MIPVAAKKTSFPDTRSDVVSTAPDRAPRDEPLALLVVAGREAALDRAAHARERRGGDDTLRRASDPDQQVDAGARGAAEIAPPRRRP